MNQFVTVKTITVGTFEAKFSMSLMCVPETSPMHTVEGENPGRDLFVGLISVDK